MHSKLTIHNLHEQMQAWKQPYLQEANQTAIQFSNKVKQYQYNFMTEQSSQSLTEDIKYGKNEEDHESTQFAKMNRPVTLSEEKSIENEPKTQEWKPNIEYRFDSYEQLTKNYHNVFQKKQKIKKSGKNKQVFEDFRADERAMIEEIYQQIKEEDSQCVTFESIISFFEHYELFYYFYNIHSYRLENILKEFAHKNDTKLTKQELFDFFLVDRPTIFDSFCKTEKEQSSCCILSEDAWRNLKAIFDTLDTFGNEKISIQIFFQRVKKNSSSISLLNSEAVEFPSIHRIYTLEKIFFDLENKVQFDKKVEWGKIEDLIINFEHVNEPTIDQIWQQNIQSGKIQKDSNQFLLEDQALEILKSIFNRCPKYCKNFVKTAFFSFELLESGLLKPYFSSATRLENSTTNTYRNLQSVIKGLSKESPQYFDMDEMLQFFSIKGPHLSRMHGRYFDEIELTSSSDEQNQEDRQRRRLKKMKSLDAFKKSLKKSKKKKKYFEVTKAKQFNLHKREAPSIRQRKVQEMIAEKQLLEETEIKKQFKANPIPVSLNPERYQKYSKAMQKKKESILNRLNIKKEADLIIIEYLKSNTKLFETKKIKKHCESKKQAYLFESKPLPLNTSEELLHKIEAEKNERRKKLLEQTNKKYKEVYWKNLRNTSSFDNEDSLLEEIRQIEAKKQFEQIKANEVPNFEELHLKFEQELQKRKNKFKPTVVREFKLTSPDSKKRFHCYYSPQPYRFRSNEPKKYPKVGIKSTKKYDDWVAYNQTRLAQRQIELLEKEEEKEERLLKQKNFAKFMRKSLANCTDNTASLKKKTQKKLKQYTAYVHKLEKDTEQELAKIYARVLQRPFLFEESSAKNENSENSPKKITARPVNSPIEKNYHGIFDQEGEDFHPIESQNLNQSF